MIGKGASELGVTTGERMGGSGQCLESKLQGNCPSFSDPELQGLGVGDGVVGVKGLS